MQDEARYTIGVAGMVMNDAGYVLLIRTAQAGWELPGGRVEPGEDLIAALEREVREETGCAVAVGCLAGLSSSNATPGLVIFTFRCAHTAGMPFAGDDSLDAGWFAPDAAVQIVTHPAENARLRDALTRAAGVVYRVYGPGGSGPVQRASYHV